MNARSVLLCTLLLTTESLAFGSENDAAERHANQAKLDFQLGRIEKALESYLKANEALPKPTYLFQIAQCYQKLKDHERAISFYEQYLEASGAPNEEDAHERGEVNELIEASRRDMDEDKSAPPPPAKTYIPTATTAAPPPPPPDGYVAGAAVEENNESAFYETWWFWTIVGGAAAAAAVGTAVALN